MSQIAIRIEYNGELQEQPKWLYGLGGTWFLKGDIGLSFENLNGVD